MIVFNLACAQGHCFEGWFGSTEKFQQQSACGLVSCPACGDTEIEKQLSAPRLNIGDGAQAPPDALLPDKAQQAGWGDEQRLARRFKQFILSNTENVGPRFAEIARRMHYGEEVQRNIRGRVSREESAALRDEGIDTMTVPAALFVDEGMH